MGRTSRPRSSAICGAFTYDTGSLDVAEKKPLSADSVRMRVSNSAIWPWYSISRLSGPEAQSPPKMRPICSASARYGRTVSDASAAETFTA